MGKHILPDGGEDLLSCGLEDHGLEIGTDQTDNENARIDRHRGKQLTEGKFALDHLLNAAYKQGREEVVDNGEEHHHKGGQKALPVGLSKLHETAYDLTVRHVPVKAHGVLLVLLHGIDHQKDDGKNTDDGADNEDGQILSHGNCLLPLPASADLPSSGRRRRSHTAPRGCPQRSVCPRPETAACPSPEWWRCGER